MHHGPPQAVALIFDYKLFLNGESLTLLVSLPLKFSKNIHFTQSINNCDWLRIQYLKETCEKLSDKRCLCPKFDNEDIVLKSSTVCQFPKNFTWELWWREEGVHLPLPLCFKQLSLEQKRKNNFFLLPCFYRQRCNEAFINCVDL